MKTKLLLLFLSFYVSVVSFAKGNVDVYKFGFSSEASGMKNLQALQKAVDCGGTISINVPGIYRLAGTVYVGSNTTLKFGNGVRLMKVDEQGVFSPVIVNKGASERRYNENIEIDGLEIIVNNMDVRMFKEAYGLHGQLAFFYVKNLRINHFRCYDVGSAQYGIHICTFENVKIDDAVVYGNKDGIHFGRGKHFSVSNCTFRTFDDAIALNAHDYAVGNPEYGWIEDGVISNCYDLNAEKTTGYFCRILAGAWLDWKEGMEVQQSDIVVSNGRLYRVQMQPDGNRYISRTRPTHTSGMQILDGIKWGVVQNDVLYCCGVRNVTFRNISLYKPRTAFSVHFDKDRYSRSYYPGAIKPVQSNLTFDHIRVMYDTPTAFIQSNTPIDKISVTNSYLRNNSIVFDGEGIMDDFGPTRLSIVNTVFDISKDFPFVQIQVPGKQVDLLLTGNKLSGEVKELKFDKGKGMIKIEK
jgi:hypothetical protein